MEKLEGDEQGYAELLKMVKANLIDIPNKLDVAIEEEDIVSVRKKAHALKGSSLNCCFYMLKDLSLSLEHIEAHDKSVLLSRNKDIKKEIQRVLELI
ncbi:Hpt domain-containing protein [Gillisia sp. JM1]|uniref:Hpt domain-containing protein n=1 Tax=Gillisia sp. JM1 TaxID=1283286 RepID=UPI0004155D96|nr:Hpt domain-containing protein [Gillisia sp. JM1]